MIPEGCVNLAFIGQFVELPLDVVFTVETSVRTALMAVWGLTGLPEAYGPRLRARLRPAGPPCEPQGGPGIDEFSLSQVPPAPLAVPPSVGLIARHISELPELPV